MFNLGGDGPARVGSNPATSTIKITNKITGRNVTKEYLALMQGIITNKEFELITLTLK